MYTHKEILMKALDEIGAQYLITADGSLLLHEILYEFGHTDWYMRPRALSHLDRCPVEKELYCRTKKQESAR